MSPMNSSLRRLGAEVEGADAIVVGCASIFKPSSAFNFFEISRGFDFGRVPSEDLIIEGCFSSGNKVSSFGFLDLIQISCFNIFESCVESSIREYESSPVSSSISKLLDLIFSAIEGIPKITLFKSSTVDVKFSLIGNFCPRNIIPSCFIAELVVLRVRLFGADVPLRVRLKGVFFLDFRLLTGTIAILPTSGISSSPVDIYNLK
ncbi:MAG: hypothetical protein ACXABD_01320 [Candidatus Thorarchaeota archaeon]